MDGVVCLVAGVALLPWLSPKQLREPGLGRVSQAGKVVAVGCMAGGTTLLARRL